MPSIPIKAAPSTGGTLIFPINSLNPPVLICKSKEPFFKARRLNPTKITENVVTRGGSDIGREMPSGGYAKFISNGTKSKKEMLSPIENNVFSKAVLPNRSIRIIKNPGRKVSRAKPKTCRKMGMSRIMKMSVKAMNDSANAQIVLESKVAIAHSIINQMNSCRRV